MKRFVRKIYFKFKVTFNTVCFAYSQNNDDEVRIYTTESNNSQKHDSGIDLTEKNRRNDEIIPKKPNHDRVSSEYEISLKNSMIFDFEM